MSSRRDEQLTDRSIWACLHAAIAAPSIHNTQPWRSRIRDGGFGVLVDRDRALDVIDPDWRAMFGSRKARMVIRASASLIATPTAVIQMPSSTRRRLRCLMSPPRRACATHHRASRRGPGHAPPLSRSVPPRGRCPPQP